MKKFHLGDILSVTTGVLVSPHGGNGLRRIMEYMCNRSFKSSDEMTMLKKKCTKSILKQYPTLKKVDAERVSETNWERWLGEQTGKYGSFKKIKKLNEV